MSETSEDSTGKGAFDPYEGVFCTDGALDQEFVTKNVKSLVEMLRTSPECYGVRVDFDQLAECVVSDEGAGLRAAKGAEALESALQEFSRRELAGLVTDDLFERTRRILGEMAEDESLSRKRRIGAAIGVGLLGGLPDAEGLRGRGVFDVVLRVSLEEYHAHEQLRRKAGEFEDGLSPAELQAFWGKYPALRHHYEERYRRDVAAVIDAIEYDRLPAVVSVDLALRGAFQLLTEMQLRSERGVALEADECRTLLRSSFDSDLLDGGSRLVLARWRTALEFARSRQDELSEEDAAELRDLTRAVQIVQTGGPGGDIILFHAYLRAILEGSFHVLDDEEASAARAVFTGDSMSDAAVLAFAEFLGERGDPAAQQRVILAAVEIWPSHDGIRAAATRLGEAAMQQARAERQGPTYDEMGDTEE